MKAAKRILLVEDHSETRLIMTRLLAQAGFGVTAAASQFEALQHCKENHFEVLVCDLLLPDGEGLDLLHKISKLYPIRAIACSGMGDEERDRCLSGGFDAYLSKPFRINELLDILSGLEDIPFFLVPSKGCGGLSFRPD